MIEYTVVEHGGNASAFPFEIILVVVPLLFMALLFKDVLKFRSELDEVESDESE